MTQNRIRALREERGWSQEELARRTNLSTTTIRNLESGRSGGRFDNLRAVADAFELRSVDELFAQPTKAAK